MCVCLPVFSACFHDDFLIPVLINRFNSPGYHMQVWQQGDASGYGCGIEFSDPTAYGLNQFDEAADMASQ